jgi:hypothetical protein
MLKKMFIFKFPFYKPMTIQCFMIAFHILPQTHTQRTQRKASQQRSDFSVNKIQGTPQIESFPRLALSEEQIFANRKPIFSTE